MVFSYFFSSRTKTQEDVSKDDKKKKHQRKEKEQKVYLVINKNSETPVGIFSSLEKAKSDGEKATYHNCKIVEFVVDDKCKYLLDSVYESK